MAFDGFVISNLTEELNRNLSGGRITKIAQPEDDELLLTINKKIPKEDENGEILYKTENFRLFISVGASLPFACLTEKNKPSPLNAPNFCMLLRKHLNSARIISITQPGLERVIDMEIEHLNEMGDLCIKHLMVELMGKHSNLIFTDDTNTIIDSMKHISSLVSSVREVLPKREYFIPKTEDKYRLYELSRDLFENVLLKKPLPVSKAIYTTITGISPILAQELCYRAGIDGDIPCGGLNDSLKDSLWNELNALMDLIKNKEYRPGIIYRREDENTLVPVDFSSTTLTLYLSDSNCKEVSYDSISSLLEEFYAAKNEVTRIRQKSADLRKIVLTSLDRCRKKMELQMKQLEDTKKADKYKLYGELLNTYGYNIPENAKSFTCLNYYTNEEISIPVDPELTGPQNAKKYFDRYSKLKRTALALSTQVEETGDEISHLESILTSMDIAKKPEDLIALKEELTQYGYMRRRPLKNENRMSKKNFSAAKKEKNGGKPLHYVSADGFDIYVGKNNFQNDNLTFKASSGDDWWFHAKKIPGSHVLVKSGGKELPDRTFEEAASLAAHYSQGKDMQKVEVDYVEKKHVKKPNGSKPGFVIYHTNYSMIASPDISGIKQIEE